MPDPDLHRAHNTAKQPQTTGPIPEKAARNTRRDQLTERGVRANVVAPGPTWTPLNEADQHMPPDGLAQIGSEADSSYTVGEVIAVAGGMVDTR